MNHLTVPKINRRHAFSVMALSVLGAGWTSNAKSQTGFPSKTIKFIVPFPPGGNTDQIARLLTQSLSEQLGQACVVDNKAGAGGNIGVDIVAKSPADGYTLAYSTLSTYALNVGLYQKLPFDPVKDLEPVALTVQVPLILVVPSSSGIKTLTELIQLCKSQPTQHHYASAGNGTSSHIACHLFSKMAGIDVQHIPYKGTGPALTDLLAGRVDFAMDAPSVLNALIKSGRLVALAVALPKRMASLPDIPTFEEAGLKNYKAYSWNAVWAPSGTPAAILDKLNVVINKAIQDSSNARKIEDAGVVAFPPMNRFEVEKFMRSEYETWVPFVKGIGVKLD
jgi:tripartite-type tricarboxylate transporter receptor subunit TctC